MKNSHCTQGSLFEEFSDNSEVQQKPELANPWALDCNGNPILPENAERHGNYTCPKCLEPLNVRKRGNGERSRRDHFYHKVDTACRGFTPHETESYIHKTAKEGIFEILQSCIDKQEPFAILWTCPTCKKQFSGNLLHHAKSVKIEKQFADTADGQDHKQPDVSLVDENGNLLVAIEVVYTHDIEPEAWAFFDANNVVVLRLKFESVEELNNLQQKLQNPDSVNVCFNITCKDCQSMLQPRFIYPLKNEQNKYFALAVAVANPFEDILYYGLPFTGQDKQNADIFVKNNWPKIHIKLDYKVQNEIHYARLIVQQRYNLQQPVYRQIPRRTHLTVDEMEARGYFEPRKSRSRSYKAKSSSYGKQSSVTKKNGRSRRK